MGDLERLIDEVNGSMSMEGMPLTKADKDRIRRCVGNNNLIDCQFYHLYRHCIGVPT